MITEENYIYWKEQIANYEKEQLRISRVNGISKCPFCGGTKTTPYLRNGKSQKCNECDKNGMISNRKLVEYELYDCIIK